jgi:hypothetical protein
MVLLSSISFALAGCGAFSQAHAARAQERLTCGLSVAEVERILGGELQPIEGRDARLTHLYRDGFTDMWLRFEAGRLRSSQIIRVVGLTGTVDEARVEHCKGRT